MTCLFGWPLQGIWPGLDYTDINTTCRSHNGTILATGDDFGTVKLFKYPSVKEKSAFNDYHGHSSHVTGVKFTANDTFLVSTGGNDKTVFVWDTDINDEDQAYFNAQQQAEESDEEVKGANDGLKDNNTGAAKEARQNIKAKRQEETKAQV
jgi:WD40 repeat protein